MNGKRRNKKRIWSSFIILALLAVWILPVLPERAEAGKEAVYAKSNVYFTLEQASLSPGSNTGTFRFMLKLVNGSKSSVDFNQYGIAVLDGAGNRYSADLTEKSSARIPAGVSRSFSYAANVSAKATLNTLKVEVFAWNFKVSGFRTTLGTLHAASATVSSVSAKPQTVLNMRDLDASYQSDALVSFELENVYKVLQNGSWNIVLDLTAENLGTASFKLPSALQVNLKDNEGLSYAGSIVFGSDLSVLPHQKNGLTLTFPVGDLEGNSPLTLEFTKKQTASAGSSASSTINASSGYGSGTGGSGSSGSSSAAASGSSTGGSAGNAASVTTTVLGSLSIPSTALPAWKKEQTIGSGGLTGTVESIDYSTKSDGVHAEAVFTLANKGKKSLAVPELSAFYQIGGTTLAVQADESGSRPDFLGSGKSTSYSFSAVLPSGLDGASIQLAVQASQTAAQELPVFVCELPSTSAGSSSGGAIPGSGNVYRTTIGNLAFSVMKTYRLLTDGGEDVIMTELSVTNEEQTAVELPDQLYAGFTDGTNDLEGKAAVIQSSKFLNPGQRTTIYLFVKVPYDMAFSTGKVYLGEGILDPKTGVWSQKKEWARLGFAVENSGITEVSLNTPWVIKDAERQSAAWITEGKLYDTGGIDTDDTAVMAAVRIEQKNQAVRSGAVVPYTGYLVTSNGQIWPLQTTAETGGKLAKDGESLTTLWAKLPSGILDDKATLYFGQQVADGVFASPMKILFTLTPNNPVETDSTDVKINASLYPYQVTFSSVKRMYQSNKYSFTFNYSMTMNADLTGSGKNRSLLLRVEDSQGVVVKSWDLPLEGKGALTEGSNTLVVNSNEVPNANDFLNGNRIKVYEKFEGMTRLLGTMNYMMF